MRPTVSSGDVALAAQPVTSENFAPFGQVLAVGARTYLGKRGRLLVTLVERKAGPRRVTHLYRYPEAKRAFLPLGDTPMWIVVLPPGEEPGGPTSVFLLGPGTGVALNEGVWHAGPVPLGDTSLCELLETVGVADRFDRKSLRELVDAEAVRVLLPEEPGAPRRGPDLAAPNAVLLDAALQGRIRLGCVCVDGLEVHAHSAALHAEIEQAGDGMRAMWGQTADLAEVPGVTAAREIHRGVGIDPERFPPRSETLLARVLAGKPLSVGDSLAGALLLCALRMRVPLAAYDCAALGEQILVRTGGPGEGFVGTGRRRIAVEGRPALCDRQGPFGSPLGDARRARTGLSTRRVLVVLYVPPSVDAAAVEEMLEGVARTLTAHCGGRAAGRLVVG